jgi:hypothetical protein
MVTCFKNIFDRSPFHTTIENALERISSGASKARIEEIRAQVNKERADKLKQNLPCFLFSGEFTSREDSSLKKHSGFLIADFDNLDDVRAKQMEIINHEFVYACWISPRGNGLKALIRIADGKKHREHFTALKELLPDIDRSGINEARVCYESYDPDIYINKKAKPFTKTLKVDLVPLSTRSGDDETFSKLVTWIVSKGDAFVTGERNGFIFKLASACCRFGLSEDFALRSICDRFLTDSEFTQTETSRAVRSAYKSNRQRQGSAHFDREILVETKTRSEVKLEEWIDEGGKVKDVIYGENVKDKALAIFEHGYEKVRGIGIDDIDMFFKFKKGEITCLSGVGNYGKSSFLKFLLVMRVILFGEKFSFFSPEDNPPQEFYHDLVEMILGADCTPRNNFQPSRDAYNNAYDWISKHIFYLYPKNVSPTPEYVKEKFLELAITEGTSGNVIDPFNQMHNEYGKSGGRSDKYLETFLSDYSRFNQENDQYGIIICHPHKLIKQQDGNYPCPDVFDLADGAMWNNKMDNIIIYHRPYAQTDPENPMCEFHSKKIRRQKIVGKKGFTIFELHRAIRRFRFNGVDFMAEAIKKKGLTFMIEQRELFTGWKPVDYTEPNKIDDEDPF